MNKIFLFVLALLLVCGVANAAGIPSSADPKNAPEVWTQEVYNNYTSALTSGSVVVWDCVTDSTDASFAYRTSWITITSTADDINVAGVVIDPSIPAGSEGTIAIYGPTYTRCNDSSDGITQDQCVGTAASAGLAGDAGGGGNTGILGWAISSGPVATAYGGYGGTTGNDNIMIPIFISIGHEAAA